MDRQTPDQVAEEIIAELRQGVGTTGIKPGLAGEIGSNSQWVAANEERSFRAAAHAHLATGVTITIRAVLFADFRRYSALI
jgi:phosphotriesterase-related protein